MHVWHGSSFHIFECSKSPASVLLIDLYGEFEDPLVVTRVEHQFWKTCTIPRLRTMSRESQKNAKYLKGECIILVME